MNERDECAVRPSCGPAGGRELKGLFKDVVKAAGLKDSVRANEAGCLDQCEHGPTVVVYPEAVWYGSVRPTDVTEIVAEHLIWRASGGAIAACGGVFEYRVVPA